VTAPHTDAADDMDDIRQEIRTLASLRSAHVTQYHASFVQKSSLWIVMEYCDAGSCLDLLKSGNVFGEPGMKALSRY
jgi:serine/threonine-protein kinase 24/25/MST4